MSLSSDKNAAYTDVRAITYLMSDPKVAKRIRVAAAAGLKCCRGTPEVIADMWNVIHTIGSKGDTDVLLFPEEILGKDVRNLQNDEILANISTHAKQ